MSRQHIHVGSGRTVPADRPTQSLASLEVKAPGKVTAVTVKVLLRHSCASDVRLWLQSPSGTRVLLTSRRGGASQDILAAFDDEAAVSIVDGAAPITGTYRPQEALSRFGGEPARGEWRLVIEDVATGDGGWLEQWSLELDTDAEQSSFEITLRYLSDIAPHIRDTFARAVARWSQVIIGDLPTATLSDGTEVDDVIIYVRVSQLDGINGVLGQAGPTHLRWQSQLPIAGTMEFDAADLDALFTEGLLDETITHEIGHVLGFGTLFAQHDLVRGRYTANPTFIGPQAMAEYARLKGLTTPTPVPLEATGGPGTAEGHWRESVFDDELMTGWLDSGVNPLSRLTVAALGDLGYKVDLERADTIAPQAVRKGARKKRCVKTIRPPFVVVGKAGNS
jgi:subtilisin-like proprotein convertase family protein